jgi:integrase
MSKHKPLLKYVQAFHVNGIRFCYFRKRGSPRLPLPGLPGSAEFMAAYQQALAAAPKPIGVSRSKPGSIAAAVAAYLSSPIFTTPHHLAKGSQDMRRGILQHFRDRHGEAPIGSMPAKFLLAIFVELRPHAARNWFKTLRPFCQFCVEQGMMKTDPTLGMKLPRVKDSGGHHTWTEEEVAAFERRHPIGSKARLALALGIYTMQRRSDVVRMGPQHIGAGEVIEAGPHVIDRWLTVRQQKTGNAVGLPIFPQLKRILDATPTGHLTFLTTKTGRPYSANDFSDQFRVWCDEAGLPQRCTYHGLRKHGATWFAERGCGAPEIAAWGGWKSLREVERYVAAARQKMLAKNAIVRVLSSGYENKDGSQTVKPVRSEVSN